jgi:hypothetical protein
MWTSKVGLEIDRGKPAAIFMGNTVLVFATVTTMSIGKHVKAGM